MDKQIVTSTNLPRRRGKSRTTIIVENAIQEIVAERHPITVRGVCYALFVQGHIPSMATKETQRVSRIMTEMRETGALDWELIVDGSRLVDRASIWRDPAEIIASAVKTYRRDYWQDQATLVEVWSEKSTVQGVLEPVLDKYGVTFRVMKGFGSFTAVRQAAEDSKDLPQSQIALYLGDWDPSGLHMSQVDLPSRLTRYGSEWELSRIAITEDDTSGLPSFDADSKKSDPRYRWYRDRYGNRAWELDAMNPNDLRQRVESTILAHIDLELWEHAVTIEQQEVASMAQYHRQFKAILQGGADGKF